MVIPNARDLTLTEWARSTAMARVLPTQHDQEGFSLVELALSLVIIGLLVGAVLQGQTLIDNARVVSTVIQVKTFGAAHATFQDVFSATPGDMANAGTRLPGCPGLNGAACAPASGTAGDNLIGDPLWSDTWGPPAITSTSGPGGPSNVDAERYLYWAHLSKAGLIGGVTDDGLNAASPFLLGVTNPTTPTGGGFVAGYDPGLPGPGAPAGGLNGNVIVQVADPTMGLQTATGTLPLTPLRAAMIDRKLDDGNPSTGFVQAYGVSASCFGSATAISYNETVQTKDCGLIYAIDANPVRTADKSGSPAAPPTPAPSPAPTPSPTPAPAPSPTPGPAPAPSPGPSPSPTPPTPSPSPSPSPSPPGPCGGTGPGPAGHKLNLC